MGKLFWFNFYARIFVIVMLMVNWYLSDNTIYIWGSLLFGLLAVLDLVRLKKEKKQTA